jgi:hypothetical protein
VLNPAHLPLPPPSSAARNFILSSIEFGLTSQTGMTMDRIISIGLLSPERWINDMLKSYLLGLRNHPAVSLDVGLVNGENRVRMSA